MKRAEHFWAGVGKLSALLGLVGGVVALWARLVTPTSDLHAKVSFSALPIPATAIAELNRVASPVDLAAIDQLFKGASDRDPLSVFADLRAVADYLASRKPSKDLTRLDELRGYWLVELSNTGALPAKGVSVTFPREVLAEVRAQGKVKALGSGEVFEIGQVLPSHRVQLTAWSETSPSFYDSEKIVVSYSAGLATTELAHQEGWLKNWAYHHGGIVALGGTVLLFLLSTALVSLVQFVFARLRRGASERSGATSSKDSEPVG